MSPFLSRISDRRLLQLLAVVTFCYWLAHTLLLHMPIPQSLQEPSPGLPNDKTVHVILYAGFATALFLTFEQRARVRPTSKPRTRIARAGLLLAFCLAHGYLEEFTQPLSGRTYDPSDFAADCIGTSVALGVCLLVARFVSARAM